ncbi:hypothetical protein SD70_02475 [Gordoniibacillus kamchatkensis]|uniref:Neck protein n=1 Tax=Gordoniibacillus kamchatkensis TaxID=1590651 RepID=A0ABR5AMF6_9BACL|nr:hypothetical protein [Paenibacillus sp. VKM B-2647]KIL42068.1 hypothetical protein SD70_02475 [Paenibacillus sp. VKM B-2647]
MFTIDVDFSKWNEIYDELEPDLPILQQGIVAAAEYVRDVWVSAVQGTVLPGMTRPVNDVAYAKSLSTGESMKFPEFFYGVVMPVNYDDGAELIETGYGPYDMKPGLLNGPKSRPTADGRGRFNTVPFRHFTPQANSGISVKMRMPDEIYASAKQLKRSMPDENGVMKWADSLESGMMPNTSFTGYQHQSSIYQGMYRIGDVRQTQYLTFRRVSTPRMKPTRNGYKQIGSAPNSWIHPGLSPNPVVEAVYNYCMPLIEKNLMDLAEKAFGAR